MSNLLAFPATFDSKYYRSRYSDLSEMTDVSLLAHYENFGRNEGRIASPAAQEAGFLDALQEIRPALEIGPFDRPKIRGNEVSYCDILDTNALQQRAKAVGRDPNGVPHIEFVGNFPSDGRFNLVFSAHTIEHQPDLIAHLQAVSASLAPNGIYALLIPDSRYCFDHFISPSTLQEVITANVEGRKKHTLASVIEHRVLTTHNNASKHWSGDHGQLQFNRQLLNAAIIEWGRGEYVDVHAWQFTPTSFHELIANLGEKGQIDLFPFRVYDTPCNEAQFAVVLRKN